MKKVKALETIIVLVLVALVFFIITREMWLIYLSMTLLVIPIVSVRATLFVGKTWFKFSDYLGLVMNYVVMFICFYFILIPLASLQKLFGGNQILKREDGDSYFHKRNHLFTYKDIRKPW